LAILVTGIGYMGTALVEALLARGEQVIGLDNRFSTDEAALQQLCTAGLELIDGDVAEPADVEAAFSRAPISTVYHFAAQASAHPAAAETAYTERTNLQGPRVVLDAMLRHGTPTIVYASSFKVYGENLHGQISESQPYGTFRDMSHLSKVHAEKLLEMYAALHGLRCLSLRFGIVHGRGPIFKTDPRFMTAPNKFCWQVVRGETISVFGGGRPPAGWVHLSDAVTATIATAANPAFTGYVPINVVGEVASVAEVAAWVREAAATAGLSTQIEGIDAANLVDEAARFTVTSALDNVPEARAQHHLRVSLPAVLDYCRTLNAAQAAAGATR
jgi:nucleoside-diphosphate-sugar epimerase